jgi:formate hydrogenlyase subunit 3/multisubunit Na+/H+ antiporter MnhD subunit
MTGAIFLVFMHSITKLMLFLSLDILEQRFGQSSIEIFKQFKSPFLIIIFIIGFLSLLGLPPFGGFIAKLTILSGLAGVGAYIMMGAILVISLVEAVYLFRLLSYTKDTQPKVKISIPLLQKAILASIAFAIIYFGIFPNALLDISQQVASSIIGGVHV